MNESSASPLASSFAEYGEVEIIALTKIQKLAGAHLTRSWTSIPHVFHFDEADVTTLEQSRAALASQYPENRVTSIAFHVKAVASVLKDFPTLNSSLDEKGEHLILKKYYNVGVAVATPTSLLVPVIREVDKKTIPQIAAELAELSRKARAKGLSRSEMSGGGITISSLGRQGGTAFTPIINPPEVAILGTSRLLERPVSNDGQLGWRTFLPLSLSYDHRVINGSTAAAFVTALRALLGDPERLA